ncbi:DNA-binding transcriptional regulator YbjK [Clavibacter michiganensis]|uniref:TetR/AcrR family transcriptional regulator n=1 Tax=Clavibacter michiganensis TaxID=28447 RepID=UPI001D28240E|nr:TetR family transcriptional regulator [Clavibacter michiganensis]MBP2456429.1 DNA-binding transcriptional regulator YbjK [Clavibacter michiganensis]MDQ0408999.1 DNA-binding transcriptional regulator YbjK [Clavibacter michiganensis]
MSGARPDGRHVDAPVRRSDPGRRDRIIDACLDVIAESGVAGTSHRRVAAAADVPLGSMTYHFAGMDELLHEAFARFAGSVADRAGRTLGAATTPEEAERAVIDVITRDVFETPRAHVLTHELYTLAARRPEYRVLTEAWMARSRDALERWFDPATARLLDAFVEGITIHRALDGAPADDALVAEGVRRILRPAAA